MKTDGAPPLSQAQTTVNSRVRSCYFVLKLTLSGGPRLTLASDKAVSPYFDITSTQSAASGLPVYDAKGGVYSWGAGAQARYEWTPQWATHVFVEYKKLLGDVADAPLVVQRGSADQVQFGVGVSYSFDVGGM